MIDNAVNNLFTLKGLKDVERCLFFFFAKTRGNRILSLLISLNSRARKHDQVTATIPNLAQELFNGVSFSFCKLSKKFSRGDKFGQL